MTIKFNHIHIKARDPDRTAAWYAKAFGLTVGAPIVRDTGDRFLNCTMADGTTVIISGPRTGEDLPPGSAKPHLGLEHFAVDTQDFDAEFARLVALGAKPLTDRIRNPDGVRLVFLEAPDDVRFELMYFPKK
jgi:catechol 2,3-dioxygenase-like lactoylglutathione lyase family enzyme